jgi:prepilin-type N-terminal cleavage/methylation domain-containing protein
MAKIKRGFTLMELLIVIAIIGILSTVLVVSINPAHQLAKARDVERETDVISILSAIQQYASEHSGDLPDTDGDSATSNFPTSLTCIGTDMGCFNLAGAGESGETIVPEYMAEIPKDPKALISGEGTDGNTGYKIMVDTNGRLTASASGETKEVSLSK